MSLEQRSADHGSPAPGRALEAGASATADPSPAAVSPAPAGGVAPVATPAVHVVILAGGFGERFWPASTPQSPKPFARLFGGRSLLQDTIARARRLAPPEHIWLVGSEGHAQQLVVQSQGDVAEGNILLEPCRRDTGPAVALAAATIAARAAEARLVIMPSDHHVPDAGAFADTVGLALAAADAGYLTCLGIPPQRPDARYGYILRSDTEVSPGVHAALRFVEKPDPDAAAALLRAGNAYWNAGVLVCRARDLLAGFAAHAPAIAGALPALAAGGEARARAFAALPSLSLDYAVLQQAPHVAVARAGFRWHDVGNWAEMPRVEADGQGNFVRGPARLLHTQNSVVYNTTSQPVVVAGMDGVLVASAEDHVTLVTPLGTDARGLLGDLARDGGLPQPQPFAAFLQAAAAAGDAVRVVDKPWGWEVVWAHGQGYAAKVICVRAGHALSRQYHAAKCETHWYLYGSGVLEHAGQREQIRPGLVATIRPGEVHRVHADTDTCFLEASTSELDDVVRLDDRYGRA